MAWLSENSHFNFGKYKGTKVMFCNDRDYIKSLHHNSLNVYFLQPVLDRLGIYNSGKIKTTK